MAKLILQFMGTSSGTPSPDRSLPCIYINWKGFPFLFDMGEGCQRELMKHRLGFGSIRDIFISHMDMDHFVGLFGFIETFRMADFGVNEILNIYAPRGFESLLVRRRGFVKFHMISESFVLDKGDFSISAFKNLHKPESYGFVLQEKENIHFNEKKAHSLGIKGKLFSEIRDKGEITIKGKKIKLNEVTTRTKGMKIVYSGDTMPFEGLAKIVKDADILIHECTFDESLEQEAHKRRHSTVKDAAVLAKKAKAKKLILTHFSPRYSREDEPMLLQQARKHFKGEIILARDGTRIEA
ncbi:MAG: ribonuclease Z [Candidatus Micrarchaeota archaeon]|nr:ribonuclease Z [Candidatus Micrarchaeota archaeon]